MPRLRLKLFNLDDDENVLGERVVEGASVMLGRGTDCDWVLDDPDRRLSRHHCAFRADDTGTYVTDLSSNGIFVNGGTERLARDEPVEVVEGDRVAIGGYVVVVGIEESEDVDATVIGGPRKSAPAAAAPPEPAGPRPGATPVEAFLAGADVDPGIFYDDEAAAMFRAGRLFRRFADDLHDLLNDRSVVKAQFRAEQTLVRHGTANPFKTLPVEELALRILEGDSPGFLAAESAVEAAFRDIKRHQMALLGGMHVAVARMIERLNPHEIENLLRQRSTMSIVSSGGKKAAAWDAYQDFFERIEREVGDLDNSKFMADFRAGYEARLRELEDAAL